MRTRSADTLGTQCFLVGWHEHLYLKKITQSRFKPVPRDQATRFKNHAVAAFVAQNHGGWVELEQTVWDSHRST